MLIKNRKKGRKEVIDGDLNGLLSGFLARKRMKPVIPFVKKSKRICDIGCGIFRWAGLLGANTYYAGVDIEEDIIRYNTGHYDYTFYVKNVEQTSLEDIGAGYDLVLMLAVFEHLNQPEKVLRKIKSILSQNGIVVLTTPHPWGNFILNIGAKFQIFNDDKHTHHKLFNKHRIKEIAKAGEFRLKKYKRFLFGFNQLAVLTAEAD